jgi:hypothetical protein
MKAFITTLFLTFITVISFAQAPPQGINYQAVAYDFNRTATPGVDMNLIPAANRDITVRFSIIALNPGGTTIYREYHQTTTDIGGLFNLIIGKGILDNSPNSFEDIDWGAGDHFLKVEIDNRGAFNYLEMSTQQLWSVPYALYAKRAANGIDNIIDNGDGTLTINFLDSTSYTTTVLNGLQGPQGVQGPQGIQGPIGQTGPQGPAGANGTSISNSFVQNDSLFLVLSNGQTVGVGGVVGPQGIQGPQGVQGPIGQTGPIGPIGPQGPAGANGTSISSSFVQNDSLFLVLSNGQTIGVGSVVGPQGIQGPQGATGPQGPIGPIGPQGVQGSTGATGATGPQGPIGLTGPTGPQGPIGPIGPQGIQGVQGPAGTNGQNGVSITNSFVQGDSLYVTLSNGQTLNTGYVRGPIGPIGPQGITNPIAANITALDTARWNAAGNDWKLNGNAGTNPTTNFIGTTDNQDLVIKTNNTEKIRIKTDGNVGIGTNTPQNSSKLDVSSTTQGFLAPRMTNAQRDAIAAPADGLIIFNISSGCPNYYNSGSWYEWCGTGVLPTGVINSLSCGTATNNGTLTSGIAATGASSLVPYTGGNGGTHNGQTVTSTGVTGLIATLVAGTFANGAGSLTYTITGTPSTTGTASFALNIGGQTCILTRTVALPVGTITALSCGTATNTGTLTSGIVGSGVSSSVPYTGGNGGTHNGQTVTSTGVTGLTATLTSGTFANGAGTLTYTISGTPSTSGTASFVLNIGGQTCVLTRAVSVNLVAQYPAGSVFCASGPTAIVDVINPTTGRIWMDRNLGASQVATGSTDAASYGDLYQWGRRSDGHQCRNSAETTTLSSTDQPLHGDFITGGNDWRNPQNPNLWQGVNGVNNPCPSGYRLPTDSELSSWGIGNSTGAFSSPLKLTAAGQRYGGNGGPTNNGLWDVGVWGYYWTSTASSFSLSEIFRFSNNGTNLQAYYRKNGASVRCIKN